MDSDAYKLSRCIDLHPNRLDPLRLWQPRAGDSRLDEGDAEYLAAAGLGAGKYHCDWCCQMLAFAHLGGVTSD